ncbi:hypothetical protein MIND_00951600 [Mycena indigotica]|uniref:Uncharacterized protein n=1 Tax=Mycena indigotica TaxID=2126181 RepID=A0A8H6SCU2_9AGAR|nr:uncharacterized protein MIND_00951600 [Mycena indigotica]KAF7297185.1 hypothetical protein MIND_00951600 [Mycena indigotica]
MFSKLAMTLRSTYAQITLSAIPKSSSRWCFEEFVDRITVAFFLFSFVLCCAQGLIQAFLYGLDSQFASIATDIVRAAEIPAKNITFLEGSSKHYTLNMCDDIPHGQARYPCMVIFRSGVVYPTPEIAQLSLQQSDSVVRDFTNGFGITTYRDSNGVANGVSFRSSSANPVVLSKQCTQTLVYPQQLFQDSVREDLTFIFLQFWLFGVSLFALAKNSVPHLLTALAARAILVTWSTYVAVFRTHNRQAIFQQTLSNPGTPCGVELFPQFFNMRTVYDLADLVLSWSGLLLSCLLSWYLLRLYNAASFKRVGAPSHINRIYKFFMAVQACLQMEVFVLVAATRRVSIFFPRRLLTNIPASHTTVYNALVIASIVLVLPWIALGWYGVRREHKGMMISFLGIAFFFVAGWALMFYSIVYRWSFVQWPYLGCFTVASFILIIASVILGTICWRHFGEGLTEYLNAEAALADSDFAPEIFKNNSDDVEKAAPSDPFYSYDDPAFPLPTFHGPPASPLHSRNASMNNEKPASMRGPPPAYDRASIQPF